MNSKLDYIKTGGDILKYKDEFDTVNCIISIHRKRVILTMNNESISMVWEVGGYVSNWLKTYSAASFSALIAETDITKYGYIVPFEMAQIPRVLFANGWTNHHLQVH